MMGKTQVNWCVQEVDRVFHTHTHSPHAHTHAHARAARTHPCTHRARAQVCQQVDGLFHRARHKLFAETHFDRRRANRARLDTTCAIPGRSDPARARGRVDLPPASRERNTCNVQRTQVRTYRRAAPCRLCRGRNGQPTPRCDVSDWNGPGRALACTPCMALRAAARVRLRRVVAAALRGMFNPEEWPTHFMPEQWKHKG